MVGAGWTGVRPKERRASSRRPTAAPEAHKFRQRGGVPRAHRGRLGAARAGEVGGWKRAAPRADGFPRALRDVPGLNILSLFDCTNLQSLDGLDALHHLTYLNLIGCTKIPAGAITALRATHPDAEIDYEDTEVTVEDPAATGGDPEANAGDTHLSVEDE